MGRRAMVFKWLRLGDSLKAPPSIALEHTPPEPSTTLDGARAGFAAKGAGAQYITRFEASMFIDKGSSETRNRFWARVRKLQTDLLATLEFGNGIPQFGPLASIQDIDGVDAATLTGAYAGGVGTMSLDGVDASWTANHALLLIDDLDPQRKLEIARITAADSGAGTVDITTEHAYAIGSQVYRVEWWMPEAALIDNVEIPASDSFVRDAVIKTGIRFAFSGSDDQEDGGLA